MKKGKEVCLKCKGKGCLYCDEEGTVSWLDNIVNRPVSFEDRISKIMAEELTKEIDNDIVNELIRRNNDNRKLH